jgi:GAF domain-containing protein
MAAIPSLAGNEFAIRPLPDDLVEELQRVQKIAQTITSILDLDQVIDSIVNDVATWFGCLEASVFLHDEERHEMVMASVRGCTLHGKGHRLKIGQEGMVGHVADTGRMHYAPDVRKDKYYIGCENDTLSEVAIPLCVGDRLVGVFTASHPDLDAFPRPKLRILQALCDHVAIAIHNARRFQVERAERAAMDRDAKRGRFSRRCCRRVRRTSPGSQFRDSVCRLVPSAATGTTSFHFRMGAGASCSRMYQAKEQPRRY